MGLVIEQSTASCGAIVRGVDLRQPVSADLAAELRSIWLQHQVIGMPDQQLSIEDTSASLRRSVPSATTPTSPRCPVIHTSSK